MRSVDGGTGRYLKMIVHASMAAMLAGAGLAVPASASAAVASHRRAADSDLARRAAAGEPAARSVVAGVEAFRRDFPELAAAEAGMEPHELLAAVGDAREKKARAGAPVTAMAQPYCTGGWKYIWWGALDRNLKLHSTSYITYASITGERSVEPWLQWVRMCWMSADEQGTSHLGFYTNAASRYLHTEQGSTWISNGAASLDYPESRFWLESYDGNWYMLSPEILWTGHLARTDDRISAHQSTLHGGMLLKILNA